MPKSKLAKNKTGASTQKYLDIAEIRDNIVVLKDGSIRKVLLASSINFALKSEEEQQGIIQGYFTFLNSIDFPIQIVVQSRKLNMDKYLQELNSKMQEQTNELLRNQISEYRKFVTELVSMGNIMGKKFYIVIPYSPKGESPKGFFSQAVSIFSPAKAITLSDKLFNKYVEKIGSRVDRVVGSLSGIGVTAVPLETQSLIELYYNSYNIQLSEVQKIPPEEKMKIDE